MDGGQDLVVDHDDVSPENSDVGAPVRFLRPAKVTDIAERAGVSTKTVSRVLNGEPYVAEAMRKRVLDAAEELGYVPDQRARVLRSSRSGHLGLIIPDVRNGYFAQLTHHLEKRLATTGQLLLLGISDEEPDREARYLRHFLEQRIDGLVILPSGAESLPDFVRRIPTVVLDRTFEGLDGLVDHVLVNDEQAAYSLTRHLIEHHHLERVVIVGGEESISSVRSRMQGYHRAMADAGLEPLETVGHMSAESASVGAHALLRRIDAPFGVFCTGNRMFLGAFAALRRLGLEVPGDASVVTFGGSIEPNFAQLLPTQAVLPVQTMVARALQLLTERINSPEQPLRHVQLDCDIEYGSTCGCVPRPW